MSATVHADMRQAAMDFLTDFAASQSIPLQIYPGRPWTIAPPCAFVDRIDESISREQYFATALLQRTPIVAVYVLHGKFDSKDAVSQRDKFMDGFVEWTRTRYHQAGGESLIEVAGFRDLPVFNSDWLQPERQQSYFGTEILLRGTA